jgi:hypothetical protein
MKNKKQSPCNLTFEKIVETEHHRHEISQFVRGTRQNVHARQLFPIQWPILPTNIRYQYGKRFVTVVG